MNYYAEEAKLGSTMHIVLLMPSLFIVFIVLVASYIVSEASLITSRGRSGSIKNLTQLIRMGSNVGYREGSFVYNLLVIKGFEKSKLVSLKTEEEMVNMLSRGTSKGGVDAIVANEPHLKYLQSKHCYAFTTAPTTNLHATGFGFAFGKGSDTVNDVSRGILKLVDNGQLGKIQDRTIGSLDVCQDDSLNFDDASLHLPHGHTWMLIVGGVFVVLYIIYPFCIYCYDYCMYGTNNTALQNELHQGLNPNRVAIVRDNPYYEDRPQPQPQPRPQPQSPPNFNAATNRNEHQLR